MSHQLTSEEQLSGIKAFFTKTWKIIAAVIVIGLIAVWGWRYWHSHQQQKSLEASETYERLISKLDRANPSSVNELVTFANENDTIYSVFADLRAAQFYVETLKDYAGAKALLSKALAKTDSEPVQSIINIRIARLQYQLAEYEDSLKSLDKVSEKSWSAVVNDVRGDVLVKMERYVDAINAYQVALTSTPSPELDKAIKIKLNQAEYLKAKQVADQESQQKEQEASKN